MCILKSHALEVGLQVKKSELTMYVQHFGFMHQRHHLSSFIRHSFEAAESPFIGTDGTLLRNGE